MSTYTSIPGGINKFALKVERRLPNPATVCPDEEAKSSAMKMAPLRIKISELQHDSCTPIFKLGGAPRAHVALSERGKGQIPAIQVVSRWPARRARITFRLAKSHEAKKSTVRRDVYGVRWDRVLDRNQSIED
jgi:hypothetical protein